MATTRGNSSIRWLTSHLTGLPNAASKARGLVVCLNSQAVIDAYNSHALIFAHLRCYVVY